MPGAIPAGTRAVFFDAVGTLLFPEPPAAVVYAGVARRAGVELPPAEVKARFLAAYRAEEAVDRLAGWVTGEERETARWRRIVADTLREVPNPDACFRELFDHFSKPAVWRVAPDAGLVLSRLRDRGLILGMGSNYDSRLLTVLDGFPELSPLRDRVVVSAAVGFRKPAAEFFREVVRAANCEPGEVLFVGDDVENDYDGATAAGLRAVLLDTREKDSEAERRIRRLGELGGL
jgi:putative hydrolase of the HAD superfamily